MQFLIEPSDKTCVKGGVLIYLLSNSIIDLKQRVFVTNDGRVDYFGNSPMAMLLTMYTLHHHAPEKLATMHLRRAPLPREPFNALSMAADTAALAGCIENYFRSFHPYFPVVSKAKFLKRLGSVPRVLVNMVCAIGAGYSPHLAGVREWCTAQAVAQLRYSKTSLDTMTAMLLMANYQHAPGQFSHGWAYLGYAMRMGYALGLDRVPPRKNRDPQPSLDHGRPSRRPQPSELPLPDLVSGTADERAESACSLAFTRHLAELCHLMCLMVSKFNFMEGRAACKGDELLAHATARHLDLWCTKVDASYQKIGRAHPTFAVAARRFALSLRLIYYGTLVQLLQTVQPAHSVRCTHAANNAILLAASMGDEFNFHSITYKFYALASAIMIQIQNCRAADQALAAASSANLQIGLQLLESAIPYYPLAGEFHRLASLLAQAEMIPLHQNMSFLFSNFSMPLLSQ
ncbi:hypothetical protein L0F63_002653 [Massospora cicadina]|nr:hypothetical protein L0F63_002653 [Massospora cicadina]